MPSRYEDIAAFYIQEAAALQRAVAAAIVGPTALIEDACSHAWCQLLAYDHVELGPAGFGWLMVVAKRHAYRLSTPMRREWASGLRDDLPQPAGSGSPDPGETEFDLSHRERVEIFAALPERQRRLLLLQAAGFSYEELARLTGDTVLTVGRQIRRGKKVLRDLQQQARREACVS